MTARRFIEWEEYARLEPFGELRADYRAALIASTVFNMAVAVKDRKPVQDFLLKYGDPEPPRRQSPQEQLELIKVFARAYSTPAIVENTEADRASADALREQVEKARAAMRET